MVKLFFWFSPGPNHHGTVAMVDTNSILASDWTQVTVGDLSSANDAATYGLFVNGKTLSSFSGDPELFTSPPESPYPYTRLATTSQPNSYVFYLYHQINETTIAEDAWDESTGVWTSSKISIPTE